jgi:hypothetical protein
VFPSPGVATAGTWVFDGLAPAARANVLASVAAVRTSARPVLELVDGSVAVDGDVGRCPTGAESCSYPEPVGSLTRWRMHLSVVSTAGTYPSQRFMVLHEIGHAVWVLVLRDVDQAAFVAAVDRALSHRPCRRVRDGGPCAAMREVFSDEFARWAGGFKVNMTSYQTPPLLPAVAMQAIVDAGVTASTTS